MSESPSGPAPRTGEADELQVLADATALSVSGYLDGVAAVASGRSPETALPVLLLAVSEVLVAGARLGALADVIPSERFEPEPGDDADVDPLRVALARVLDGVDEYADLVDPLTSTEVVRGSLSDDLTEVAAALLHGVGHHVAGRTDEALWWWQFSYLSEWGDRAASALRVLQSILGHVRLDADAGTVEAAAAAALRPA
jgi:Domain of unknown function (DUF5063)